MSDNAQNLGNLVNGISIGGVVTTGRAVLAPMSGVTDIGMRRIAQDSGASLVVSEMVASDEYVNGRQEARLRAEGQGIATHVVQIAGCDGRWMAEAARMAEASGAHVIDINMGCPSKRVNGKSSGSALMRDLTHATTLIEATIAAVKCPVTLKMRLGWDDSSHNAPDLARRAQDCGVQLVTVHGRTRQQFYKGRANWRAIRPVREAIVIPLVANGDCETLDDARQIMQESAADAVMIGRAAVGRPWLVGEIARGLSGARPEIMSPQAKAQMALEHLETLIEALGPRAGIRHARKHLAGYADHMVTTEPDTSLAKSRALLVTSEEPAIVRRCLVELMTADPAGQDTRTANETRAA